MFTVLLTEAERGEEKGKGNKGKERKTKNPPFHVSPINVTPLLSSFPFLALLLLKYILTSYFFPSPFSPLVYSTILSGLEHFHNLLTALHSQLLSLYYPFPIKYKNIFLNVNILCTIYNIVFNKNIKYFKMYKSDHFV